MELELLEYIRKVGVINEIQLATNLNISSEELHHILPPLITKGYVAVITKHGRDCLECSSQVACPGSRIHLLVQTQLFLHIVLRLQVCAIDGDS